MTCSFEEALGEARAGDAAGFEWLYEELNQRVHSFVRLRGCADPEGLVNDVFLQVFMNIGRFDGSEPQFKAWVFRIARNKLIDEYRQLSRRPTELTLDALEADTVADDNVEAQALMTLGTESVLRHLERLTDEQREVLLLRIVGDLTIESVAAIVDKNIGAVKALQRRALRTLAQKMSPETRTPTG